MKGVEDRPDNTAKWAQDSDAWEAFGGMTVTQRMDRLKAVLKEAQEALGQDGAAPEEVMNAMVEALHEALPADRRPKLPWSALINLINAGIGKVGWTFNGRKKQDDEAGPAYTADEYGAALKAAVDGLGQWLPNNAVNHQALPTVSPAQAAAEELPLSQYQVGCISVPPCQTVRQAVSRLSVSVRAGDVAHRVPGRARAARHHGRLPPAPVQDEVGGEDGQGPRLPEA